MHCCAQAAAAWMLEREDLDQDQQRWLAAEEEKQKARLRAAERDKEARKATVSRWARTSSAQPTVHFASGSLRVCFAGLLLHEGLCEAVLSRRSWYHASGISIDASAGNEADDMHALPAGLRFKPSRQREAPRAGDGARPCRR